jgi:hypothetical protein
VKYFCAEEIGENCWFVAKFMQTRIVTFVLKQVTIFGRKLVEIAEKLSSLCCLRWLNQFQNMSTSEVSAIEYVSTLLQSRSLKQNVHMYVPMYSVSCTSNKHFELHLSVWCFNLFLESNVEP